MRYPASEKLEIIRLFEGPHLSARQTLAKIGIPRTTFYRWYDRYLQRGEAGLQDQSPKPKGMKHSRGAPYYPQTQGKIERWHQTLKNRILLENYFLPGDLEAQIEAFVDHYNYSRYHESLNNVTAADVYFGRDKATLQQRERSKRNTLEARRLHRRQRAA